MIGFNDDCDYLDLKNSRCIYLEKFKKKPSFTTNCSCIECIRALANKEYTERGSKVKGVERKGQGFGNGLHGIM